MAKTILVVDDELNIRKFIKMAYGSRGFDVYVAGSAEEALKVLKHHSIDVMITDMKLPKMNGLELMKTVRNMKDVPYVVMMTAHGDIELAVDAMKAGAFDFLSKPFKINDLEAITNRIFNILNMMDEGDVLNAQKKKISYQNMIGLSSPMRTVFSLIEKVAGKNSTVLLTGESGTGKELAARAIHDKSSRKDDPFIALNCTAIAETMLEAELFGFEKGAFTDAKVQKKGLFELADHGTIFFDEIGDMPLNLQAKLLRVLQEKTFRRIGGQQDISVDVRILSATHQNLESLVAEGSFREDLFYRLNVFPIELPALRERKNDILLMANMFISEYAHEFGVGPKVLSAEVERIFKSHEWRGNIRELKNIIERMMIVEETEEITLNSLPASFQKEQPMNISSEKLKAFKTTKAEEVDRFEIDYLTKTLIQTKGNVSEAARIANLDRSAFQRLLRKHHIQSENFRLK